MILELRAKIRQGAKTKMKILMLSDRLFSDRKKLEKGQYNIVFAHPKVLVSSKQM